MVTVSRLPFNKKWMVVCITALGISQEGLAQQAPESGFGRLEEITVTARKREESALDIPVLVAAISGERMQRYDLSDMERIAASVPQMTIARASNGSGAQIALRGIGSSFTSIGVEQSVATIVDGAYFAQGRIINEGLFDLQQVEIMKGPQALFFGKNATAGSISVVSQDPGDEFEMMGRVGYEVHANEVVTEGMISGPVTDTLGMRLAIRARDNRDGYVTNRARTIDNDFFDIATGETNTYEATRASSGQESIAARLTVLWQPTDDFSANIKAFINQDRIDNPSWNYIHTACEAGGGFSTIAPDQACKRKFRTYQNNFPKELGSMPFANSNGDLGNEWDSHTLTATLKYDAENFSVESVTNWQKNDNTFLIDGDYVSSSSPLFVAEKAKFEAFSTEARALSNFDGPVNFMAGLYYQNTELDLRQYVAAGLMNSALPESLQYVSWDKDSNTDGETQSLFMQMIWDISPTIEFAAGGRYTYETKDSYFNQPLVHELMQAAVVQDHPFTSDQKFENFTPEATLSWKPTDNLMLFGAFKMGYKSGGFSNTAIFSTSSLEEDFSFEPEEVKGFELGAKGDMLDGRLRYGVGIYYYEYTDLQIDFFNAQTLAFITTNAGSAETEGVELDLEYSPSFVDGLILRGTVNYNKARYKDYIAPCYGGQTITEGCTLERFSIPHQDLSGSPTSVAPRWTASLGANYEAYVFDRFIIDMDIDSRYSDSYLASSFGNPVSKESSYVMLNAAIRLRTSDDRWELAVIGKNLTNKFVVNGGHDTVGTGSGTGTDAGVPSDFYGLVGMPRSVQVQATWRF